MPRSEQDLAKAVTSATDTFWRLGYDQTSIEEVVKSTGLNRYALYNAFGGKLDIFLAALDHYYTERRNIFLSNFNNPETAPIDAIGKVMEFAIAEMAERQSGCMMCNVASEVGRHNQQVMEQVTAYLDEIKWAYGEALTSAQKNGELNSAVTPSQGAELLITVKMGLAAQARNGANLDDMSKVLKNALALLRRETIQ